jgi:excisionase family DNA binding protein
MAQRWATVNGAASHSAMSEESIRRLIAAGKLKAHRPVRGRILIDLRELDTLIETSVGVPRLSRGRWRNGQAV